MVGLHYLKHAFNESDESVVARWVENPYWQYCCGEEFFRHKLPIDPSQMTYPTVRIPGATSQEGGLYGFCAQIQFRRGWTTTVQVIPATRGWPP